MQTTLFFTSGSSDKVYQANIVNVDIGFMVDFAYGRRGNTLKTGTKTKTPVSREKAQLIFDKLIKTKIEKGYTADIAGAVYTNVDKELSDVQCQLLNPVSEQEMIKLCGNGSFIGQEKFDGVRQLLEKTTHNGVRGINRKGLYVGVSQVLIDALEAAACTSIILDGEGLGDTLIVFDILELDGQSLTHLPYSQRYKVLTSLGLDDSALKVIKTAYTTDEKLKLVADVKLRSGEGVVFKDINATYSAGRPNSGGDQLKFKFYDTASVLVSHLNEDRRSVKMSILNTEGIAEDIGNVTIPPNYDVPNVGDIIEIKYLYAYQSGSLYQPQYLGKRTDIDRDACVISQLKYKPTNNHYLSKNI